MLNFNNKYKNFDRSIIFVKALLSLFFAFCNLFLLLFALQFGEKNWRRTYFAKMKKYSIIHIFGWYTINFVYCFNFAWCRESIFVGYTFLFFFFLYKKMNFFYRIRKYKRAFINNENRQCCIISKGGRYKGIFRFKSEIRFC